MRAQTRLTPWTWAIALLVAGGQRALLAQVNVAPDTTNSTNQTIGTAGSTATSTFSAYWNFGTTFPSQSLTGSSGNQIRYTLSGTGGTIVTGSPSSTNPSSGYTLASGTPASGLQNYGLAASYPATISGSSSPSFRLLMQAQPSAGTDYLYDLKSVQLGSRSAASGPTTVALRWDEDGYKQDLASASVSANSTWGALNLAPAAYAGYYQTIGLFGVGGSGSASPNWQIDDLQVSGSLYTITGASRAAGTYGISSAGSGTFSGNFSITGTATFSIMSGGTVAVTGPVSGMLSRIDKSGAGTLKLSGSNTLYGPTVINAGSVVAGSTNAFGYGKVAVNNGATLDLANLAIGNKIETLNGAIILNAGNYRGVMLVSTGTTTYSGTVSGTMAVAQGAKANFDGVFTGKADLTGTAAFNSSMSGIVTLAGSGSASFADLVSGSVSLSGSAAKAYFSSLITGTVAPSAGALSVITGTVDPSAQVSVGDGGKMQLGTGADFQQPTLPNQGLVEMTNTGSTALTTSITGTGGFKMAGAGITALSGSSSFTGGTTVSSGTLQATDPSALGTGSVDVGGGAKLALTAALALAGTSSIANQGIVEMTNSGSVSLTTPISGTGQFTMAGSGLTALTGSNSFTGGTGITTGTLQASNPNALGQGPVTVEGGGKLVLDTSLQLGGTNGVSLQNGAELALQQSGSAPVTTKLSGSSVLDGVTMTGSNAATASAALLAGTASGSGGLLATDWTTVGKPASALSDILDLSTPTGSSAFVLSMNYSGSATSSLWLGWNSGTSGWINAVDGNLGPNNASGGQLGYLGSFDAFQTQYGDALSTYLGAYGRDSASNTVWAVVDHNSEFVALVTVPEPAAIALALTGLGAAGAWRRRRRCRRCQSASAPLSTSSSSGRRGTGTA